MAEDQGYVALTEGVYYILWSSTAPARLWNHAVGAEVTNERVNLAPGTLYGALNNLLERGWIRAADHSGDKTRKEYCITQEGKQALMEEIRRLEELVQNGRRIMGGMN